MDYALASARICAYGFALSRIIYEQNIYTNQYKRCSKLLHCK